MDERLKRARTKQQAIREVLLRDWDPIGVSHEPRAQDEYDSYIAEIYGMLIRREPRHKLVDSLWWIETEHMGLFGDRRRTERVADLLLQLNEDAGGNV